MELELLFANLPPLETPRLRLRRLQATDAADVFAYASDPEVARYTSWEPHRSIADSQDFLARTQAAYARHEPYPWGLVDKITGRLIGTCGLLEWSRRHHKAELGYALHRGYWGQGLIAEAASAVIDFGFTRMELNRIEAVCLPENTGSWRVMEKVGMTREGLLREWVWSKGQFRDLLIYAILRRDWQASS
jgi:[ribosomal protein S5]-alanine N-acetyltransferase